MENFDKKKGVKNVAVSIFFRILLLVGAMVTRRFLIDYAGNILNGLDSLYTSILGFLAVAELGVGTAITFCMYKPIVEGDDDKVSALYGLFNKLYLIIGGVIFAAGCAVMPFLRFLVKDYNDLNVNLYLSFAIMLVSVVATYLYSSKISLMNAYKNNYVATTITSSGLLLQYLLQITVLVLTRSFYYYLLCRIAAVLFQWAVSGLVCRKKEYKKITDNKRRVDDDTKKEVVKSVKAMFMHKIGSVMVNTVDSIIISAFVGAAVLGCYTNYVTIVVALMNTAALFFTPLTSVIGHLYFKEDKDGVNKYFNFFHAFNFVLGVVLFLGYYAIIDDLVSLVYGADLIMDKSVSFVITLNYFLQFLRQSVLLFRDSTGTFYYDRWKAIIESLVNLVLSVAFVYAWGVVGVIAATVLTNLFICHVVEPHVLYKYALFRPAKRYYVKNYICIAVFAGALVLLDTCMQSYGSVWKELLVNGAISVAISSAVCAAFAIFDRDFREYLAKGLRKIKKRKESAR